MSSLTGVKVSAGFPARARGRAAARLDPFTDRVRGAAARVRGAVRGRAPARTAGKLHYVHDACTEFLTCVHTGGRTAEDIDADGILPGYPDTIARDGSASPAGSATTRT